MNPACFFQKYTQNRWISIFRSVYIKFYLRTNKKRIKYLRDAGAVIGEGTTIHSIATLGSEPYLVEIGDNVYFSGTETRIFTHDGAVMQLYHMGLAPKKMDYFGRVKIGNNCFIAHNVIILKNVEIGDNCIIGAGSVVTRNIPAGSVACGVPARVTGTVENYYMRHKDEFDDTFGWDHARKREYLTMKYSDDKDQ